MSRLIGSGGVALAERELTGGNGAELTLRSGIVHNARYAIN